MHENVHKAINAQFGMDSKLGWTIQGPLVIAYTQAIVPEGYRYQDLCDLTCSALHIENEIVSYNLEGLLELIICLFVIYGIFQHKRSFDNIAFAQHIEEYAQELEFRKWRKENGL
jgi:hypothetical protein